MPKSPIPSTLTEKEYSPVIDGAVQDMELIVVEVLGPGRFHAYISSVLRLSDVTHLMIATSPTETGFGVTLISNISVTGRGLGSGSLSKWEQAEPVISSMKIMKVILFNA